MKTIVYTSEYVNTSDNSDLDNIIQEASNRNKTSNITGVLLFHNNNFLQVLEGKDEDVDFIFNKIKNDTRHKNIDLFITEEIEKRAFPNWEMRLFDLNDSSKFSPELLRRISNIYLHNFQFNAQDYIFLLESMLNDIQALQDFEG